MIHARRPSVVSKRKPFKPYIFEFLEPRRLLTTFTGGQSFTFFDERGNFERISFFGNITAEVIGATGGGASLINLPPATIGAQPNPNPRNSLFAVYVSQSDFTGGFTLAQIPNSNFTGNPITNLASIPFTNTIGTISVQNAQSGLLNTIGSPAGSGAALIGALAGPVAPVFPSRPVLSLPLAVNQTFGVLPGGITTLNAGITVAAGQDIGNIYVGGTVTGSVQIGAAINNFYAGWLITGNSNGEFTTNNITIPQNFSVAGDIRNLLVGTSIGTDSDGGLTNPTYVSGFDMHVGGTIGTVRALNGSIVGAINSDNLTGVPNNGDDQGAANPVANVFLNGTDVNQIENRTPIFDFFANDVLGGNAIFQNDSFATPQYISNGFNALAGTDNSVVVDGTIEDTTAAQDKIDYYAVPLLAGQTITVQVTPVAETDTFTPSGAATNSVFELTATLPDLSTHSVSFTVGSTTTPEAVTAGLIAAWNADPLTSALAKASGSSSVVLTALDANTPLNITGSVIGLGTLVKTISGGGIGGVQTGVFDPDGREIASDYNQLDTTTANQPFQFTTDRPGVYRFAVAPTGDSFFTGSSGVRGVLPYTLSISNVGHMAIGAIVASANICDNTNGGLFGAGGTAGFGTQSDDLGAIVAGGSLVSASGDTVAVENGSVRALQAATIGTGAGGTDPEINVPNGNVGLVQSTSGDMYFNNQFSINTMTAPPIGGDYELVSSAGNLLAQIVANGNIGTVRAQRIVGDNRGNSVFRVDANHASNNGQIDLIDDAGNFGSFPAGGPSITVGPNGTLKYLHVLGTVFGNPNFGGTNSDAQTLTFDPGISDTIVEASGAIVTLVPVVTTDQPAPTLTVTSYALDDGGSVVVKVVSTGGLTVQGSGQIADQGFGIGSITVQGEGNTIVAGTNNLTQTFSGKKTIPVQSPPSIPVANAPLNVVFSGNTQIDAFDVIGGNFDQIANNTPGGEIVDVHAASIGALNGGGAIGLNLAHSTAAALLPNAVVSNNFPFNGQRTGVVVSGSIVNVSMASVGNLIVNGSIGTIVGSIVAPVFAGGQINNVILGPGGIHPSGSGNLSDAGIYATGAIANVVGNNTDIRGNIVSTTGIQSVALQNGSIIDSTIANYITLSDSEALHSGVVFINHPGGSTVANPILTLGSVATAGNGGIIGSIFGANGIGVLSERNGFGIINSFAGTLSDGFIGSVYADGYGLRRVGVGGGFNVGSITANGNGALESTAVFSNQVRFSERVQFDPLYHFLPNAATDIDSALGATVTNPVIPGVTDTGVIEDSSFNGNHNLKSVRAWSIRSTTPALTTTAFAFPNSIGSIITTGPVDGMSVVTGKLGTLSTAGDLKHTAITISGRINNLTVHANITDSSSIIAHGRNGNIGKLTVLGNMEGLIEADGGKINTVTIHGSLFGRIKTKFISNLVLFQNLGHGSLEITGSAGTIRFVQDLGPVGNTLTVDGRVNVLKVGSNLTGNINILGNLNKLQVGGAIVTGSRVTIQKTLQLLQVGSDFQAGAIVQAHAVKKVKVRGVNAGSIVIV